MVRPKWGEDLFKAIKEKQWQGQNQSAYSQSGHFPHHPVGNHFRSILNVEHGTPSFKFTYRFLNRYLKSKDNAALVDGSLGASKGGGFDSQLGYILGLQFDSWSGACRRRLIDVSLSINVSLSL